MNHHPAAGWYTVLFGWAVSGGEWLFGGMSGFSVIVSLATLVLTVLKIAEAIRDLKREG